MARSAAPGAEDSQPDLAPGTIVDGRYKVVGILGEGGVGTVYRAEDLKLPRQIALKVLQGRHVDHASLKTRFAREARALAALSHPNIVHISDYGVDEDKPFVVMELLEGHTLRELLDAGPIEPKRAFDIAHQLLKGLAYAHAHGLVHRDIKPGNIFLQRLDADTELVKILDFGFAKFVDATENSMDANVSRDGLAFGTLSYLAPEQATGAETDARSDVYSSGVVLFEMLAGIKPFSGSLSDIVRAHLTASVPRISSVSKTRKETPELHKVIEKAMAKRPDDRFADASQLLRAIDALPQPAVLVRSRPRGLGIWLVPLFFIAAILVTLAVRLAMNPDPRVEWESWVALVTPTADVVDPTRSSTVTSARGSDTAAGRGDVVETDDHGNEGARAAGAGEDAENADGRTSEESEAAATLLAHVRSEIEAGRPISDESMTELRTYVRGGNDLPAAHLLLGHAYIERGWVSDALHHYENAYDGDPRVKDDPRVLDNLIQVLATSLNLDREATQLIEKLYGVEALPAIEAKLAGESIPWDGRGRLGRLQRRLAARARAND